MTHKGSFRSLFVAFAAVMLWISRFKPSPERCFIPSSPDSIPACGVAPWLAAGFRGLLGRRRTGRDYGKNALHGRREILRLGRQARSGAPLEPSEVGWPDSVSLDRYADILDHFRSDVFCRDPHMAD